VHLVFTTAYDQYALQAFETSAVDYLLKPVESTRLEATLEKIRRLRAPSPNVELEQLVRELAARQGPPKISARRGETIHIFDPRRITRFHAQDRYIIFRHDGQEFLHDGTIVALEEQLGQWGFLKVHRSELINLDFVESLSSEDDVAFVKLVDGQRAAVSRRHLKALKQRLGIVVK
jgi:DNA-binding LytR/AlgR family response regulator